MADRKISDLTALTAPASGDYLPIVDISESAAASKNKRVTVQSLFQGIPVNVGIGTSSPTYDFQVGATGSGGVAIDGAAGAVHGTFGTGGNLTLRAQLLASSGGGEIFLGGSTRGDNDVNAIVFSTSNTERLRIDSSGNVGIGTSSPSVPLQVLNVGTGNNTNNGAISLCRTTTVGSTLYHTYSTAVSDEAFAFSVHGGTAFSDTTYTKYLASAGGVHIWYGATNATERLRIDSSGRVGIGTSSPDSTLHVLAGAVAGFRIGYNNTSVNYYDADTQIFRNIAGAERLRIDSSGNVGIGTSSPGELLDVRGGSLVVGSHYVSTVNTNYRIRLESVGAANNNNYTGEIGLAGGGVEPGDSSMTFATRRWNGSDYVVTEKVRIDSSGRVGIGTTAPTTLLDVDADTVRVRTARTPASATATGATGEICWDANYIYVCTATNTWKRAALSTW